MQDKINVLIQIRPGLGRWYRDACVQGRFHQILTLAGALKWYRQGTIAARGHSPRRLSVALPAIDHPPWVFFFYRDRLEALSELIRPSRRKPKCDRTATNRHVNVT